LKQAPWLEPATQRSSSVGSNSSWDSSS
jgi:hypothetical protein